LRSCTVFISGLITLTFHTRTLTYHIRPYVDYCRVVRCNLVSSENVNLSHCLYYSVHVMERSIVMSTKSACQLVCLACLSAGIAFLEPFSRNSPNFCSAPGREAEYCDERVCLSVCVCDCLSAIISSELHVPSSPFFCMLPMAVAQSSSGSVVICYVLPVLWMTSYLLISQGCSTSPLS